MDKKKVVKFLSVSLALILIFILVNIGMQSKIDRLASIEQETRRYYLNGLEYSIKGELRVAEAQFKKALEAEEFNSFPKFALETLADADRGIINKEYVVCFFKGIKCLENTEYQQALKEFENAIKINPAYVKAYNCIGNVYHSLLKPHEAITYYKKAVQIDPKYTKAYNNLGGEYFVLKQYQAAIACVEKSLQIVPNDAQNYYNLGLAYSFLKKTQQARENFQKARDIYKQKKDVKSLQRVNLVLKKF